jgi:hypothetical protein
MTVCGYHETLSQVAQMSRASADRTSLTFYTRCITDATTFAIQVRGKLPFTSFVYRVLDDYRTHLDRLPKSMSYTR